MEFIPALRYDFLTPLYDFGICLALPERRFKMGMIESARIAAGHHVLDVGCGTGTLLIIGARQVPHATFIGLDADERILARARHKIARAGLSIRLDRGSATDLPYPDATFDRVLSTLAFHHLTTGEKKRAFAEAFRILRPRGELHLGDFGAPDSRFSRVASYLTEKIGREHVEENFQGVLPAMARATGFEPVDETGRFGTVFGVLRCFRARKT